MEKGDAKTPNSAEYNRFKLLKGEIARKKGSRTAELSKKIKLKAKIEALSKELGKNAKEL